MKSLPLFLFIVLILGLFLYRYWNEAVPVQEGRFSVLSAEFKEGKQVSLHGAGGQGKPVTRTLSRQRFKRLKNQPRYDLEIEIDGGRRLVTIPEESFIEGQASLEMRYKVLRNGMIQIVEVL